MSYDINEIWDEVGYRFQMEFRKQYEKKCGLHLFEHICAMHIIALEANGYD